MKSQLPNVCIHFCMGYVYFMYMAATTAMYVVYFWWIIVDYKPVQLQTEIMLGTEKVAYIIRSEAAS